MEPALAQEDNTSPQQPLGKLWLLLALLAPLGFILSLPYLLPVLAQAREAAVAAGKPAPALWIGALAQGLQVTLFTTLAAWVGARLSRRTGLDAPYLRAWVERRPAPGRFRAELPRAVLLGALFSAAILALNLLASSHLPDALRRHPLPPMPFAGKLGEALRGATSDFYGGLIEEILCRWGLLTALAALLGKLGARDPARFWGANSISALLFGAGHLPVLFTLHVPMTALAVAYIVLANALAGLVCGWLFYRRGLEAAMVAHGFGDICIHALPLLFS